MDTYETLREEIAEGAQERAAVHYADIVRTAIRAVPDYAVTPLFMAQVAACLSDKAKALGEGNRWLAQNYLDDLSSDMGGAN